MAKVKDSSVVLGRVLSLDPDISITVEAKTVEDEPIIKISNKKTGTQSTLPYADISIFNNDSVRLVDYEIQEKQSVSRKKRSVSRISLYHPMNYVADLVSSPGVNDYTTSRFYAALETLVRSQDEDKTPFNSNYEKYIPYLVWDEEKSNQIDDFQDFNSDKARRASRVPIKWNQSGWVLYLTGLDELPLGFAEWNDEAGIIKLAKSMYKVEVLKKKALKLYPEQASELALYDTVHGIVSKCEKYEWRGDDQRAIENAAKLSPTLQLRFLHKFYRNGNIYDRGVAGFIDPVVLDKYNVAFRVSTPYSSLVKRNVYLKTLSGCRAYFLAKRSDARELKGKSPEERNVILDSRAKEAVRRYRDDYILAVESTGWRVIDYSTEETFSPSYAPYGRSEQFQARGHRSSFWVTKLSDEEWDAVAPFCSKDNAEREYQEFIF